MSMDDTPAGGQDRPEATGDGVPVGDDRAAVPEPTDEVPTDEMPTDEMPTDRVPADQPPGSAAAGPPAGADAAGTHAAATDAAAHGGSGAGGRPSGTGTGAGGGTYWSPPPPPPRAAPGPGPGSVGPPGGPVRRLRRSRRNRMVAGVAGGIGEHLDIDPVVIRVAFAVLAVFGGAGVLLYLLCWLFMPDEGQSYAPADTLFGRGVRRTGVGREVALIAVAALVLVAVLARHRVDDGLLLVVVLALAVLLFRHLEGPDDGAGPGAGPEPPSPAPGGRAGPSGAAWSTGDTGSSGTAWSTGDTGSTGTAWPTGDTGSAGGTWPGQRTWSGEPGPGAGHQPYAAGPDPRPDWQRRRVRKRSLLGAVGFCAVVVLLGLLTGLDRASLIDVSPRGMLALVLAVIGAVLVVGAFRGRARGLVALGVPVALVLMLGGNTLLGGWGNDWRWSPSTASEVRGEYRLSAGRGVLDLRAVDFTGQDVHTSVRMGAGVLRIELPPDVDLVMHGSITAGSVDAPGRHAEGFNRTVDVVDDGLDGPGGGRLEIRTTLDFGAVQVIR